MTTDNMFPVNTAGSTHPMNDGMVSDMTAAPSISQPTPTNDALLGKAVALGIAAKGTEIATTAADKKEGEGLVSHATMTTTTSSTAAPHHTVTSHTAPAGTQVHVAVQQGFSFIAFHKKLEEAAKTAGRAEPTINELLAALLAEKDVTQHLSSHGIKTERLKEYLTKEAANAEPKPLPQAVKNTFFELTAMEDIRGQAYCAKETFKKVLQALEQENALPRTFSAVELKSDNLLLFSTPTVTHPATQGHHTHRIATTPALGTQPRSIA